MKQINGTVDMSDAARKAHERHVQNAIDGPKPPMWDGLIPVQPVYPSVPVVTPTPLPFPLPEVTPTPLPEEVTPAPKTPKAIK